MARAGRRPSSRLIGIVPRLPGTSGGTRARTGLTERNRLARVGYTVLVNKYYLDCLYTDVIVGAVKGPIARAAYWFNQNVLDGVVNGAGDGVGAVGRRSSTSTSTRASSTASSTASGAVAEEPARSCAASRPARSSSTPPSSSPRAAVLAGIFVIVV